MTSAERARAYRRRRQARKRLAMCSPGDAALPALLLELRDAVKAGDVAEVQRFTDELLHRAAVNRYASRKGTRHD